MEDKGGFLFSNPTEALCGWGWAARLAGSTCLTCSAHCPLRPGTAARSWAHCQELPGPLQRCALTCPLSLPPLLLCPPGEAGTRTSPMSHLDANPKASRERKEQMERGGGKSPVPTPEPCAVGHGSEAGWGLEQCLVRSGPNLRPVLSLSLFGESRSAVHPPADSVNPRHWNPQDLELSMDIERQRQLSPGAQSHC